VSLGEILSDEQLVCVRTPTQINTRQKRGDFAQRLGLGVGGDRSPEIL